MDGANESVVEEGEISAQEEKEQQQHDGPYHVLDVGQKEEEQQQQHDGPYHAVNVGQKEEEQQHDGLDNVVDVG